MFVKSGWVRVGVLQVQQEYSIDKNHVISYPYTGESKESFLLLDWSNSGNI